MNQQVDNALGGYEESVATVGGGSNVKDEDESRLAASIEQLGLDKPAPDTLYFLKVTMPHNGDRLTEEQYQRLRSQIDAVWPKNIQRPILLEGGITATKL